MSEAASDERWASQLRKFSPSPNRDPDAGLRARTHYERRLPKWRLYLRQWLIPIVRWETPYLASMQKTFRSPVLDSYFALTANLGTHTFFMTFLPICFWCGYPHIGLALAHMLAMGVVFSGAVKDLVCLPRPLSPPLQRITMSGSAALEYGFPSTHTTNAVSIAFYALHELSLARDDLSATAYTLFYIGFYCYAVSITVGRMYCGMHGFFDIVIGFFLGVFITWLWLYCGVNYATWVVSADWTRPGIAVLILGLVVRFHPEPADNCPCFDDSVSFLGVIMGLAVGTWQDAKRHAPQALINPFWVDVDDFPEALLKCLGRLVIGIITIFAWRAVTKPFLLKVLPPTFRFINHWGLMIPRRYFLQANKYQQVPPLRKDDNVLPAALDIPSMLSSFRHPRRRRVSVGPQSEADARELLATREQRRHGGKSASSPNRNVRTRLPPAPGNPPSPISEIGADSHLDSKTRQAAESSEFLQVNTRNASLLTPPASDADSTGDSSKEDEKNDREMFSALEKPRTRYDVEVITKLIVYAGIAWLAVMGNPILFERCGLT